MKNITFSAQEEAIERARRIAARQQRTLNDMFREWLEQITYHQTHEDAERKLNRVWKKTNYLSVGKKLSREEMNER